MLIIIKIFEYFFFFFYFIKNLNLKNNFFQEIIFKISTDFLINFLLLYFGIVDISFLKNKFKLYFHSKNKVLIYLKPYNTYKVSLLKSRSTSRFLESPIQNANIYFFILFSKAEILKYLTLLQFLKFIKFI